MIEQRPDNYDMASPQSAELFHLIVENVKDYAIFMTDLDGRVASWNPGVERVLGYTENEIVGQSVNLIFTAEDVAAGVSAKEMETAERAGRSENKRWHLRKDGSRFWANGMVMPLKTGDGALRGFANVMRDDTTQKLAEEQLAKSTERVREVLESISDAFFAINRDWRFTYVNRQAEILVNSSQEDLLGKVFWDVYPTIIGSPFEEMYRRAMDEGVAGRVTDFYPDHERYYEVSVYPAPNGITVYFKNVTERMRTKEILHESEQFNQDVIDSLVSHLAVVDQNGVITAVNLAWRQFAAENGADWTMQGAGVGTNYLDVCRRSIGENAPEANSIYEGLSEVLAGQRDSFTLEYPCHSPTSERWFLLSIAPLTRGRGSAVISHLNVTQRKAAELALRESEEKYRSLFNSIDEGYCIIEMIFDEQEKPVDYRFLQINSSFEKQTGLTDALGKTMREFAPQMEERWFEIYGKVVLTGEPVRFENHAEQLNRWFNVYAFRFGEAANRQVAAIFSDITTRKQAEQTIIESETRFRKMADHAPVMIWVTEPDGSCTYLSQSWYQFTGQTPETGLGFGWLDATHPDDKAQAEKIFVAANEKHHPFRLEYRLRRQNDEYAWAIDSAQPRFSETGEFLGYIGSVIDITERKQAEENLNHQKTLLEALTESVLDGILIVSPEGKMLHFNNHFIDMWNFPAEIIESQSDARALDWAANQTIDPAAFLERVSQVYGQPDEAVREEMPMKDGRIYERFGAPIMSGQTRLAWVWTFHDITERTQAERECKRLLESEQELRQTAEQANRLKDEFLATLSHELRTPLNAILGWSQMLQTQTLGDNEKARALVTIERNARAQNQLIDDLLDVSRIINGKLRLDVRAVDLGAVITAAVDAARPAAAAKNIRLQMLLDPSAGPISGDPDRLQQVVWNLLSNALKFTPKEGRIQVRLERVNSHVEIVVSDTGKGIEPEFLAHVFDRFSQSDGSMTRRHGGLGLGLAIVRQLVELHGGTVSVGSGGSGLGATFTVNLPLLPVRREPASDVPRVHPKAETGAAQDCSPELIGLRVLLVDDEADSRDLLNLVLNSCGASVTTANSAAEALEIIGREKFNVILSDIGMPEEDGFSLIKKVRNLTVEQGGSIPAIALTAYARSEDRVQALRSGFQMHIAKPVEPSELIVAVANLAGRMRNPD